MNGIKAAGIEINRKALANMAIENPEAFKALIAEAKSVSGVEVS
jgi:large subunit ribosomal protein L20